MRPTPFLSGVLIALAGCLPLSVSAQHADLVNRGKKLFSSSCFLCHGMQGESSSEVYPKLAGQHAEYVAKQLDAFKTGKRKSAAMAEMASRLSAEDMLAIGHYLETQNLPREAPANAELAASGAYLYQHGNRHSGVPACAACHGPDAMGAANLPRLAGQFAQYVAYQLKQFGTRARTNDNAVMQSIAGNLTPQEIEAVAEYLSGR